MQTAQFAKEQHWLSIKINLLRVTSRTDFDYSVSIRISIFPIVITGIISGLNCLSDGRVNVVRSAAVPAGRVHYKGGLRLGRRVICQGGPLELKNIGDTVPVFVFQTVVKGDVQSG